MKAAPTYTVPEQHESSDMGLPVAEIREASAALASQATAGALWYAVRVRSRFEWKVSAGIEGAGFGVFLPTFTETVRWSDRSKPVTRPLFTGYVFASFERFADNARILAIPGAVQILGNNEHDSISGDAIANLRKVADSPGVLPVPYVAVSGSTCRVKCGPLAGCIGVIVRTKGRVRLIVSVELLGRSCAVELDVRDVEDAARER
jgi:transcription antitermination factor NusG